MRLATLVAPDGTATTAAAEVDGAWRRLSAPDLSALLATGSWPPSPAAGSGVEE